MGILQNGQALVAAELHEGSGTFLFHRRVHLLAATSGGGPPRSAFTDLLCARIVQDGLADHSGPIAP